MVVQHRFPLLLRKLDPETSISTPVLTRLFHRGSDYSHPRNLYSHARNPYSHPPGIFIHIAPESVFTCPGIRTRSPMVPRTTEPPALDHLPMGSASARAAAGGVPPFPRNPMRLRSGSVPESMFPCPKAFFRWRGPAVSPEGGLGGSGGRGQACLDGLKDPLVTSLCHPTP